MGDPEAVGEALDQCRSSHLEWMVPLVHFAMLLAATALFFVLGPFSERTAPGGVSSLGGLGGRSFPPIAGSAP